MVSILSCNGTPIHSSYTSAVDYCVRANKASALGFLWRYCKCENTTIIRAQEAMDNLPRKFEPGKRTFSNRDSRSNHPKIVFATGQIYSEKRLQILPFE